MEQQTIEVMKQCTEGSLAGTMKFLEVVQRLIEVGVERYYVDFVRSEKICYLPNGKFHVEPLPIPAGVIAQVFCSDDVVATIRASQQNEISYQEFLTRVIAAGCTGYSVYLNGQRAVYFGRTGDQHIEYFPGSQP